MNLIDTSNLDQARVIVERAAGSRSAEARRLADLLVVVLQGCTPYLGYHAKVENALERFVKETP